MKRRLLLALIFISPLHSRATTDPDFIAEICPTYARSPMANVVQAKIELGHLIQESIEYANCEDLNRVAQPEQYALCESLRLKFIHERIFTADRIKKLQEMFGQIKKIALDLVYEKYPNVSSNKFASKMVGAIGAVQIPVDFPTTRSRQLDVEGFNALTFPNKEIYIGGILLLIDKNPDALYQVLSHEMGHVVGPTYTFRDYFRESRAPIIPEYDQSYPFDRGLQCISSKVQTPNFECFERVAEELAQNGISRELGAWVQKASDDLRKNPYVSVILSVVAGISCQTGQAEESFGDYFASEILTRRLKEKYGELQNDAQRKASVQESMGFFCLQALTEERTPQTGDSRYPPMENRFIDVIFSNPYLQQVFEKENKSSQCLF